MTKKKEIICKTCKFCKNGECEHVSNLHIFVKGRIESVVTHKEKADKVTCNVWECT